jgi:hypothetical protein
MEIDPSLDLLRVGGAVSHRGVNLPAADHAVRRELRCRVLHGTEIVDPHRDLPHVGAADQPGTPPGRPIPESDHRMLVSPCALLGVPTQAIGQALPRRSRAEAKPLGKLLVEAN